MTCRGVCRASVTDTQDLQHMPAAVKVIVSWGKDPAAMTCTPCLTAVRANIAAIACTP